jgi:hypothetical protein
MTTVLTGIVIACVIVVSGCAGRCPTSLAELQSDEFQMSVGPDTVAAIGTIARFVDSPDAEFRGYDVGIDVRVIGLGRNVDVYLVVVQDRVAGVDPGDQVVVVGTHGRGNRIMPTCLEPVE